MGLLRVVALCSVWLLCTCAAAEAAVSYIIKASSGPNGSITPSGRTRVARGGSKTYSFTPKANHRIARVFVDGKSIGAVTSYTFSNVTSVHTISVRFATLLKKSMTGSVSLAWNPPSIGASLVAGYKIYYGHSSRNYSRSVDVGKVTTCKLRSLAMGQTYFISATAYDAQGRESDYSEEISYLVPSLNLASNDASASQNSSKEQAGDPSGVEKPAGVQDSKGQKGKGKAPDPRADSMDTGGAASSGDQGAEGQPCLLAGLGAFPPDAGWIDVIAVDSTHKPAIRVNWPEYNELNGESRVVPCDIDGDGKQEIIVGMASVPGNSLVPGGYFEVLDSAFNHRLWGKIRWDEYNRLNGSSWPACGDLDGDGRFEVIIGLGAGGQGRFEVFGFTEGKLRHKKWGSLKWKDYSVSGGEVRPAAGDVNQDGRDEIILGLGPVPQGTSMPAGVFEILDSELEHLSWGRIAWGEYNRANGETWPATGDFTGIGRQIVMGLGPGGNGRYELFRFDAWANRVVHSQWRRIPWEDYAARTGETRPAAGNLDDDPGDEIVIGLGKQGQGYMYVFDDAMNEYASLFVVQSMFDAYNAFNGETRPAIVVLPRPIQLSNR